MATRRPLVLVDGGVAELPPADSVPAPGLAGVDLTLPYSSRGTATATIAVPGIASTSRVIAGLAPRGDNDADDIDDWTIVVEPTTDALAVTISCAGCFGGDFSIYYQVTP